MEVFGWLLYFFGLPILILWLLIWITDLFRTKEHPPAYNRYQEAPPPTYNPYRAARPPRERTSPTVNTQDTGTTINTSSQQLGFNNTWNNNVYPSMKEWITSHRLNHDRKLVIIGPSGAGKSSLLGILEEAILLQHNDIILLRANPAYLNLVTTVRKNLIQSGYIHQAVGTSVLQTYSFDLVHQGASARNLHIEVADGPGGGLFLNESETTINPELNSSLHQATDLLLILDPNNPNTTGELFIHLPNLLANLNQQNIQYQNIIILLSKVDLYFSKSNTEALNQAKQADTNQLVKDLVGVTNLRRLKHLFPNTKFWTGLFSIYGFTDTGEANMIETPDGAVTLKIWDPSMNQNHILKHWHPFRVDAPFLFLLTDQPGDLKPLEAIV